MKPDTIRVLGIRKDTEGIKRIVIEWAQRICSEKELFREDVNSFQTMAPLTGPKKGYIFGGSIFPSKMGPFAPF
jgi:hypothetical protein